MENLSLRDRVAIAKRCPVRVCTTISYLLHERLVAQSIDEGRSVSNLCAYLIETAVQQQR